MNQINYDINLINDNHINNYGYFYINDNPFFELMNQEKIKIKIDRTMTKSIISFIFFFILFGLGGFLTGATQGTLFFIPIIAFIGFIITMICTIVSNSKNYIWYNNENSNIEVNFDKKIIVALDSIERIIMEDSNENSIFYFVNNLNEKIKFLVLPLKKGVPFKEGEDILNDWINYLKNKKQNTKS